LKGGAKPHDYVVYTFSLSAPPAGGPRKKRSVDQDAGGSETSSMMISHLDLVHPDRAASESGADQHRSMVRGKWLKSTR